MNLKNDFILPIVVLLLICFFVSGALAIVNSITEPIISEAAKVRAAEEKKRIIPNAEFDLLIVDGLPRSITEVHRATNGMGYIFAVSVIGYGTEEIKLLCGVDPEGRIIRATVLSHNETQGLGTPIFEEPHAGQYWRKNIREIETVAVISGATITSVAFKRAMRDALTAFEIVAEVR